MKKNGLFGEMELEKIGLIRVFSNMDTQSAIVAAVVISIGTIIADAIVNLCNYIYWSAYFNRFNIPLEYFDGAIISETGLKYIIVLCIPIVILIWWILNKIYQITLELVSKLASKRKKTGTSNEKKIYVKMIEITGIFFLYILLCCVMLMLYIELRFTEYGYLFVILCVEVGFFVFSKICKTYFGKHFSLTKRNYVLTRIIGGLLLIYLILGGVYFAGSYGNYGVFRGGQVVKLVNEARESFYRLEDEEIVNVQMVLLETPDYYYVTDAELKSLGGSLYLNIWNDDTYRFIDKVDCPIKNQYVNLWYSNREYDEDLNESVFVIYLVSFCIFMFVFGCLVNVPMKKEDEESENKIDQMKKL